MNNELYQLLLSLKLGDGCFITQRKTLSKTYYLKVNSINSDYLGYKESVLNKYGIATKPIKCQSGYNKESNIKGFTTLTVSEVSEIGNMSISNIIKDLDILGLTYYYLDDGSLHKHKHFMHLYCNSFSIDESKELVDKIYEIFPQKKCSLHFDRKKDGRVFPYIYIPCSVSKVFTLYVRKFLLDNDINSMLYKTFLPSQTIENIE